MLAGFIDFDALAPVAARLGAATAVGGLIGLNRHLRHHPAGVRTHAWWPSAPPR
jgi:uncharacterized membrane protein YhiD involved in acid resistance